MNIRAIVGAAKVENSPSPYDTIHLKILYPALIVESDVKKNMGVMPVNPEKAPFPVVIFFNGFNCDAQQYQWLGIKLAERGLVVVLFNWIAETLPGMTSFTPGFNLEHRKPKFYRTAPTASALPAVLETLSKLQTKVFWLGSLTCNASF